MPPPIMTFRYRMPITETPTVSAALGCSPTALVRRPHLVRNKRNQTVGISKRVKKVIGLLEKRTLPATGMSARGPSLITCVLPEGSVLPKEKKKLVIPIAAIFTILITIPSISIIFSCTPPTKSKISSSS